jgi:dCTP deaminase
MPLSAIELAERLWDGSSDVDHRHTLAVVPLVDVNQLRTKHTASLDLRLGRWFRTMRQTKVTSLKAGDDRKEEAISREHYVRFNDHFVLHPGQFVLGITLEWLNLPIDLSGYVTGKSSWGRRGLIIETATGIHPGFTGCLTLEFANVGSTPIELSPGMQACQIFFHNVKGDEEGAVTQFVGFRKPGLGKVERDATLVALGKSYFPA